ncbi:MULTISPECIES: MrcB family domain-containing protein [unclassified Streptomyces]|uniref:MrcB family domain-containing protein n=1 Tax=unclassified Streptomyces TaxID=2593676 RepID=UPI00380734D8
MGMRDLLGEVTSTYDRTAGSKREVVGQKVLRGVASRTDLSLPPGFKAKGHGGQASPAATPWIGVFDEGGMWDPKKGLYLAYIFSADLKNVALTLQQGITWLEEHLGKGRAREAHLRHHAARLRRAVRRQECLDWVDEPILRDGATRPKAYEAASVIAKVYDTAALPSDITLMEDLLLGVESLRRAEEFDRVWWMSGGTDAIQLAYDLGGHASVPQVATSPADFDPLADFQPKDSSEYKVQIKARQQVKQRVHEELIKDFGLYIVECGYQPITLRQHPKDLVLKKPQEPGAREPEWLVEAKVVRNGNATMAVREALGQLFEYRHFLYQKEPEPFLIGLFSEGIGAYVPYLEEQGIASIWRSEDGWDGSPKARAWGMTTT